MIGLGKDPVHRRNVDDLFTLLAVLLERIGHPVVSVHFDLGDHPVVSHSPKKDNIT